jgi:hypothetical protein
VADVIARLDAAHSGKWRPGQIQISPTPTLGNKQLYDAVYDRVRKERLRLRGLSKPRAPPTPKPPASKRARQSRGRLTATPPPPFLSANALMLPLNWA